MQTLHITAADLDENGTYIGTADVTDWPGHIEIDADLGTVVFPKSLRAKGRIRAFSGSGIEAGFGIEARFGIVAGSGIEARFSIVAGFGIVARDGIVAGFGIKAGDGIVAGWGIKAGDGIEAGFGIVAKWISSGLRIFAGTCNWRVPKPEEMQIRAELRGGVIAFGEHVPPAQEAA